MPISVAQETLPALLERHRTLVTTPFTGPYAPWLHKIRLLNQLASVQVDLLRFHSQDEQAWHLFSRLNRLANAPLEAEELRPRFLELLHPAS